MVCVTGQYDGKSIVLDTPPDGIEPNMRVRVMVEPEAVQQPRGLAAIAAGAIQGGLPPDFAAQHHHYQYGLPKR